MSESMRVHNKWVMWSVAALFFFAEYFARVDPSVLVPYLMKDFQVGALALGSLSAYFYYPYIIMQIPVGLLLDRHGPRRWLFFAALVSGLGSILFGMAPTLIVAKAGRFLIGLGASFAFVGALKLATMWFKPRRLGLLAGLTQGAGMLGAAFGSGFFIILVSTYGWRKAMGLVGLCLIFFACLIFVFVRDKKTKEGRVVQNDEAKMGAVQALLRVVRSRSSWMNALYAGLLYAPTAGLAEFWGVTFFHHLYRISAQTAGLLMGCVFVGWAIGGPCVGVLSDRLGRRLPMMVISAMLSLLIFIVIVYGANLSLSTLFVLMFCYGLCNSGVALAYAVSAELHPGAYAGTSIAFTNMLSILIGALLQPFSGYLLDTHWTGQMSDGMRVYSTTAYHDVLTIFPMCICLAIITCGLIRLKAKAS